MGDARSLVVVVTYRPHLSLLKLVNVTRVVLSKVDECHKLTATLGIIISLITICKRQCLVLFFNQKFTMRSKTIFLVFQISVY